MSVATKPAQIVSDRVEAIRDQVLAHVQRGEVAGDNDSDIERRITDDTSLNVRVETVNMSSLGIDVWFYIGQGTKRHVAHLLFGENPETVLP